MTRSKEDQPLGSLLSPLHAGEDIPDINQYLVHCANLITQLAKHGPEGRKLAAQIHGSFMIAHTLKWLFEAQRQHTGGQDQQANVIPIYLVNESRQDSVQLKEQISTLTALVQRLESVHLKAPQVDLQPVADAQTARGSEPSGGSGDSDPAAGGRAAGQTPNTVTERHQGRDRVQPSELYNAETVMEAYGKLMETRVPAAGEITRGDRDEFERKFRPQLGYGSSINGTEAIKVSVPDEGAREPRRLWIIKLADEGKSLALLAPEAYRLPGGDSGNSSLKNLIFGIFTVTEDGGARPYLIRPTILKPWQGTSADSAGAFAIETLGEVAFRR